MSAWCDTEKIGIFWLFQVPHEEWGIPTPHWSPKPGALLPKRGVPKICGCGNWGLKGVGPLRQGKEDTCTMGLGPFTQPAVGIWSRGGTRRSIGIGFWWRGWGCMMGQSGQVIRGWGHVNTQKWIFKGLQVWPCELLEVGRWTGGVGPCEQLEVGRWTGGLGPCEQLEVGMWTGDRAMW